jgi:hypothetical protein
MLTSVYAEVEEFVLRHHSCGGYTYGSTDPIIQAGYGLTVSCRCGATYKRWITPSDAEYDLLWSRLLGFDN